MEFRSGMCMVCVFVRVRVCVVCLRVVFVRLCVSMIMCGLLFVYSCRSPFIHWVIHMVYPHGLSTPNLFADIVCISGGKVTL